MVNSTLHNQLIDDIAKKILFVSRLEYQKLYYKYLLKKILLFLIFLILILIFLSILRFFYRSLVGNTKNYDKIQISQKKLPNKTLSNKIVTTNNSNTPKLKYDANKKLFNGIEFVKKDHYIYQRVYKDGILIKEIKLKKTIQNSQKALSVKIPRFAIPHK